MTRRRRLIICNSRFYGIGRKHLKLWCTVPMNYRQWKAVLNIYHEVLQETKQSINDYKLTYIMKHPSLFSIIRGVQNVSIGYFASDKCPHASAWDGIRLRGVSLAGIDPMNACLEGKQRCRRRAQICATNSVSDRITQNPQQVPRIVNKVSKKQFWHAVPGIRHGLA